MTSSPSRNSFARLLLVSCFVSFASFCSSYMRIPVLPLFAASLGASTVEVGVINASFLLAAGVLSIPFGIVSDRTGRRPLILTGLCILAASSLLLWLCTAPWQMMAVYLLFGVGMAAFGPTMMSYVADITPSTHLGRAYGWYTMAIYGGMAIGPALGGFLGHWLGLRHVFPVAGVMTFIVAVVARVALPESRSTRQERAPLSRETVRALVDSRGYVAALVATVGSCFGFGVFVTFFPLFGHSHGVGAGQIGLVFAAQAVANTVSRLPFGYLSDRLARRSVLVTAGLAIFGAALALLALFSSFIPFAVVSALLGLGMGIAYTAIGGLISESVPVAMRGIAMGGYNSCIYLGMMASSVIMGIVIKLTGFAGGFVVAGVVTLVITVVFHLLLRKPAES